MPAKNQSYLDGKQYFLTGQYQEAISALETATQDDEVYARAYYYLGKAHACLKDYDKARQYFLELLGSVDISPAAYVPRLVRGIQ